MGIGMSKQTVQVAQADQAAQVDLSYQQTVELDDEHEIILTLKEDLLGLRSDPFTNCLLEKYDGDFENDFMNSPGMVGDGCISYFLQQKPEYSIEEWTNSLDLKNMSSSEREQVAVNYGGMFVGELIKHDRENIDLPRTFMEILENYIEFNRLNYARKYVNSIGHCIHSLHSVQCIQCIHSMQMD